MRYELHILSFFNVEVVLPFQQIFVHVHMMADKLKKSRPFGLPSLWTFSHPMCNIENIVL